MQLRIMELSSTGIRMTGAAVIYLKDPAMTVRELLTAAIAKTGENMRIRRFSRFVLGEGSSD